VEPGCTANAGATSYPDTGLTSGTTYYYRVKAINNNGGSTSSNTDSATTLTPPPPNAPTNLVATAVSHTQIDLVWVDNSSDETGFSIERSPDGITGWQLLATVNTDIKNYSHTGLTCGSTHYYRVRACHAGDAELSDFLNTTSATTLGCIQIFLPLVVDPEGPSYFFISGLMQLSETRIPAHT